MNATIPQFRFCFIEALPRTSLRIHPSIRRLGAKAVQYAGALASLSAAGNTEAKVALLLLEDEAQRIQKARLRPKHDSEHWHRIAPVNLDPITRWKMDSIGLLALQLLLWLWRAHLDPDAYGVIGRRAAELEPFDLDSSKRWWNFARKLFLHFYPVPERVPELLRLVTARSVKGSPGKERQDIIGKVRDHFTSFGPFPG